MSTYGYTRVESISEDGRPERYAVVRYVRSHHLAALKDIQDDYCGIDEPFDQRIGAQLLLAQLCNGDDLVIRCLTDLGPPAGDGADVLRQFAARGVRVHVAEVHDGEGMVIEPQNVETILAFARMFAPPAEVLTGETQA